MGKMLIRKGVTLIELLIVVLILASLAAVAIPRISAVAASAKEKACMANIDLINNAIEMYRIDHGSYPANLSTVTTDATYFPDGIPKCPVNDSFYWAAYSDYRVNESLHTH